MKRPTAVLALTGLVLGAMSAHATPAIDCDRTRAASLHDDAPYTAHDVDVPGHGGTPLAATLFVPPGARAGVVLLGVAGPSDRDQRFAGHCGLAALADALARAGIASVRWDDRSIGGSGGDWMAADYAVLAADAVAARGALARRTGLEGARLGYLGMSEGGIVAARALRDGPPVGFVVLLSAPALDTDVAFRGQIRALTASQPQEVQESYLALYDEFAGLVRTHPVDEALTSRMRTFLQGPGAALVPPYEFVPADVEGRARLFLGPWYRAQLAYEARPTFSAVRVPVLYGTLDRVAPPALHADALRAHLANAPSVQVETIEALNHLMQTAVTGAPAEYAQLEESFSPRAHERIAEWIVSQDRCGKKEGAP